MLVQKINNSVPLLITRNGNGKILIADSDDNKIGLVVSRSSREGGFSTPPFLHASLRINDAALTELLSEIKWDARYHQLMGIMREIDGRVTGLDVDSRGGQPQLIVVVNGNQPIPLSMFGDAVRKLVELWLTILTTPNKLLLIDEFENGVHFTRFEFLFNKLFEAALDRGIQIFATTHSAEAISAYNKAARSNPRFEAEAAYVEMSRRGQIGSIRAAVMDMARLDYEIKTQSTFRGE